MKLALSGARRAFLMRLAGAAGLLALSVGQSPAKERALGREIPAPLYGVTLDKVGKAKAELASLQQIVHMPTTRIVFDPGQDPQAYRSAIEQFHDSSYIMGELVDSSAMRRYNARQVEQRAGEYVANLGDLVDVWEVGNEVNGNWLGSGTLAKIEAAYRVVVGNGGATALTLFYEGEPSDPHNCISRAHGGDDMFSWITTEFQLDKPPRQRPAITEQMRKHLDHVLVSWYPDQCKGENPDWPGVFTRLAKIFPNSRVGFGELGTAKPQHGSRYEKREIDTYYSLARTLPGLPKSYVGGYFWWYFAEEMVPADKTDLLLVLNRAIR